MKKIILDLEEEFDYQVIGICTNLVDYRLAWEVNQTLKLHLSRTQEDYLKRNKKGETLSNHSLYEEFDEEQGFEYILVKNKSQGKFLISELELIDFFLLIKDNNVDAEDVSKELRIVQTIQTAIVINVDEHRSFEQLVF
jgi:hypothetical protein